MRSPFIPTNVKFGIGVGQYEGIVRVSRRVFQILRSEAPTPERCLEAYHLHRTRLELIAERKVRRRQLTDDGNIEITVAICGNGKSALGIHAPSAIAGLFHESRAAWRAAPVCRLGRQASSSGCRAPVSGQGEDRGTT
jgi:hypothetical protein